MPRRRKLHSQEEHLWAPEIDSFRLGAGYSLTSPDEPQIPPGLRERKAPPPEELRLGETH